MKNFIAVKNKQGKVSNGVGNFNKQMYHYAKRVLFKGVHKKFGIKEEVFKNRLKRVFDIRTYKGNNMNDFEEFVINNVFIPVIEERLGVKLDKESTIK